MKLYTTNITGQENEFKDFTLILHFNESPEFSFAR